MHIKKGDTVVVITGKSKGEKGKVIKALPAQNRVVVEGVNLVTKHKKPRGQYDTGGIVTQEAPIHVSNVMLVCPECGKPTRTGNKQIMVDGKAVKVRVCKKKDCGADIFTVDTSK